MRILTLSYEFPPIGGGGAGVVKGLAKEVVAAGHSVDLVTMNFRNLPKTETVDGIRVHRVDCGRRSESKCTPSEVLRYVINARPVVRRLIEKNPYDLVHAHFIFPDGLLALLEAAPAGLPYIITAHGSDVPGYNPKRFFKIVHPILRVLWRRVTRSASAIISPSKILADLITSVDPGTEVLVIPNGISEDKFHHTRPKEHRILVATRLVKRKGVQYLLRALAQGDLHWPAIIVGSGEYERELQELNRKLGDPARFVGWIHNESKEFSELLEKSTIYVLPSDFENFPVSLMEAMAAGAAIITTRGHGCEEVVGDTAELVTPGCNDEQACVDEILNALERLTRDEQYRARLGALARQRLDDHFTWPAVANSYLKVYKNYSIDEEGVDSSGHSDEISSAHTEH